MRFPTMPSDLPACKQGPFVLSPTSQSYSPFGLPQVHLVGASSGLVEMKRRRQWVREK